MRFLCAGLVSLRRWYGWMEISVIQYFVSRYFDGFADGNCTGFLVKCLIEQKSYLTKISNMQMVIKKLHQRCTLYDHLDTYECVLRKIRCTEQIRLCWFSLMLEIFSLEIHYSGVIMGAMASQASRLFTKLFIQAQIKENIKAPRHWALCGEFTGDRWIPRTNGQ